MAGSSGSGGVVGSPYTQPSPLVMRTKIRCGSKCDDVLIAGDRMKTAIHTQEGLTSECDGHLCTRGCRRMG